MDFFIIICSLKEERRVLAGEKKNPTDNKWKLCSFLTSSVLQDPQPLPFSHLCVPRIIMSKSLWLSGT